MSDSGPEEIAEITKGRANPIRTQAAAFSPMVFVKISIPIPKMNERTNSIQRGVENGRRRIK
jgi:hypothetical protein